METATKTTQSNPISSSTHDPAPTAPLAQKAFDQEDNTQNSRAPLRDSETRNPHPRSSASVPRQSAVARWLPTDAQHDAHAAAVFEKEEVQFASADNPSGLEIHRVHIKSDG